MEAKMLIQDTGRLLLLDLSYPFSAFLIAFIYINY
jgi:hypothetical protein